VQYRVGCATQVASAAGVARRLRSEFRQQLKVI
jgi:hypothetical protein